ncbi:MAG TPA: hypothetical protein PK777_09585 [Thermoguttaceae bacterium]|nr:hypothetical protein [Thermoguttaceae bacterium]HPP53189.1 hypothetical protein [Thermoguttaceae bacterium]
MECIGLGAIPPTGQDRLDGLLQYFQDPPSRELGTGFWVAVLIGAAVIAALWLATRWLRSGQQRKKSRPWGLFFTLCRRHRLTYSERWLLWNLARSRTPDAPARIFLDPDLFRADHLPAGMGGKADVLEGLRSRLFGDLRTLKTEKPLPSTDQQTPADSGNASGSVGPCAAMVGFPTAQSPSLDLPPWTGASNLTPTLSANSPLLAGNDRGKSQLRRAPEPDASEL